jgi:translocon-associated protein subunit alpha
MRFSTARSPFAYAEEDELDNDDDVADTSADEASVAEEGSKIEDDDTDDVKLSASPDAETTILFTKPAGAASSGNS